MEDETRVRELQTRAKRLIEGGAHGEALRIIDEAIEQKPDSAPCHAIRGAALSRLGRADESRAAFERAVLLEPDEPRHYFNLASQLRAMGLVREALDVAERAEALNPALPQLGTLLEDLRAESQAAREDTRSAFEAEVATPAVATPEPPPTAAAPIAEAVGEVPAAIRKWNWGAFWLTGLWAISHRLYFAGVAVLLVHVVSLLIYGVIAVRVVPPIVEHQLTYGKEMPQEDVELLMAPYAIPANVAQLLGLGALVAAIWFGASGNGLAWRSRTFRDIQHFFVVQRLWMVWAWITVAASILLGCLFFVVVVASASSQFPATPSGPR